MSQPISIERRAGLDPIALLTEYVIPRKPVILTDALARCAAKGWTFDFFTKKYGHIVKEIAAEWPASGGGGEMSIADYIDRMSNSTPENSAPYPFNFTLEDNFPELLEDIRELTILGPYERSGSSRLPGPFLKGTVPHEIFFGANGSSLPALHFDAMHLDTHLTQIIGDKDIYMYPPDSTPFMYPSEENPKVSEIRDLINPDYERYPLFKEIEPVRVTLHAGETLYFPNGWWHYTRINNPCLTYGGISLNVANWSSVIADLDEAWRSSHPRLAPPVGLFLKALGKNFVSRESRLAA